MPNGSRILKLITAVHNIDDKGRQDKTGHARPKREQPATTADIRAGTRTPVTFPSLSRFGDDTARWSSMVCKEKWVEWLMVDCQDRQEAAAPALGFSSRLHLRVSYSCARSSASTTCQIRGGRSHGLQTVHEDEGNHVIGRSSMARPRQAAQ